MKNKEFKGYDYQKFLLYCMLGVALLVNLIASIMGLGNFGLAYLVIYGSQYGVCYMAYKYIRGRK